MKRDIEATRTALLRAAKELMTSCGDVDAVTSRAITSRAGVNLAMINYCFGSREELLYEVFRQLLSDAQRADPELAGLLSADMSARERITLIHCRMMKLMIANFGYAKAVTRFILLNRSPEAGLEVLPMVEEHFAGRKTADECRLIAYELTSLHELAVLRHAELKSLCGIDLTDDAELERYVRESVERYLD
ncbi:MAG: TetR/AcrR family transcriptional regulator [Ruminococcus sp.]|nr:TetR/AcrR family transcriptional regulator [Ruminococcus sp.]